MKTAILRILGIALVLSPAVGFAQNKKPTAATYITKEDIDTVNKTPGVDRTIEVMDIGDQHFSVGIIHRGSTTAPAAPAAARPAGAAPAAPPANTQACGETGPSCSGRIAGNDVVKRMVKTGDIVIIPAGVPHGWAEIKEHVDYLSFRPSGDILTVGYRNPALKK